MLVTVDIAVLSVRHGELAFVAINRNQPPYRNRIALPGGFVRDEDLLRAAQRELRQETGLDAERERLHLEQLQTYGALGRDPRGRVVTVAYLGLAPDLPVLAAGANARRARWEPVAAVLTGQRRLAFDHTTIVRAAVDRARAKLEYTTLATRFCPPAFTITELRRVYEIVWGTELDPRNFHRKITSVEVLEPTGERTSRDGGRPAQLYRLNPDRADDTLYPPLLRPVLR